MKERGSLAWLAVALAAGACVVTRHGTIERLPSGPVVPVSITIEEEAARIEGVDPQTGERLEGIFHVSHERPSGPRGMVAPPAPMGAGGASPGVPPAPPADRRATIDMVGRLEGDKGTSARCTLQVFRGLNLRGAGSCRAEEGDDEHPTFRIRF